MLQLPQPAARRRAAPSAVVIVTSIQKPDDGSNIWSGTAKIAGRNALWFYWPRNWLHVQEQDRRNPRCFMNIETPEGLREEVLKAVRRAKREAGN